MSKEMKQNVSFTYDHEHVKEQVDEILFDSGVDPLFRQKAIPQIMKLFDELGRILEYEKEPLMPVNTKGRSEAVREVENVLYMVEARRYDKSVGLHRIMRILDSSAKALEVEREAGSNHWKQLSDGRDYLMGVHPEKITVEDALEAFGFIRNGLGEL